MTMSMILPIISMIALVLKPHYDLSEALQEQIATALSDCILVCISIYGIIKDHHTKPLEPPQEPPNINPIP